MTTKALITQFDLQASTGPDAIMNVYYGVVDSTAQTAVSRAVTELVLPTATPGTWKETIVAAIIADAATVGYTLTAPDVLYPDTSPGDYKIPEQVCAWTKDATKTNLPTTYTNVYAGSNGEGQQLYSKGWKQYRLLVWVNKVGTGTQDLALVDVTNAANLVSVSDTTAAGEHFLDSGWTDAPAWLKADAVVKPMAKSTVSTDDPVYRQILLYMR